jgi:hypothetical protein
MQYHHAGELYLAAIVLGIKEQVSTSKEGRPLFCSHVV